MPCAMASTTNTTPNRQKYTGASIEAATAIQATPITAAITEAAPPNSEGPRPGLTLFIGKPSLAINSLL